jgi:hypothetical protein
MDGQSKNCVHFRKQQAPRHETFLKSAKIALHRTRLRFSDRKNFSVGIFYK